MVPIQGDPAQVAAYAELINYISVLSTRWVGVGGGVPCDPQTEMNHVGASTYYSSVTGFLAMTVAQKILPGQ